MSFAPPRYLYEDYKQWSGDWELIDGYPFAMAPSPFGKHQKIMMYMGSVFKELLDECEECDVYPALDWVIDQTNVVRPDLAIYCEDVQEYPKSTPKIIVEIISKSTAQKDEEYKFELYERERVDYYILAYPNLKKVRVFKLEGEKYKKFYEGDGICKFDLCDMEVDFNRVF